MKKVGTILITAIVTATLTTAVAFGTTSAARPEAVTSYPEEWPHRAPFKLNRELLMPETERILFVVDAPRGSPADREALDHVVKVASRYAGRP